MLISIATGLGMQYEIRNKISAFNGDISIYNFQTTNYEDSSIPLDFDQDLYNNLRNTYGVVNVQKIATKFGLVRTKKDFDGVFFKGVDQNYNWERIQKFLIKGDFPKDEMLTAECIANFTLQAIISPDDAVVEEMVIRRTAGDM